MSAAKTNGKDWTHLLTDPELVGHIGKLLQAYREAPAEKREEALLRAMRDIRKQATTGTTAVSSNSASAPTAAAAAPAQENIPAEVAADPEMVELKTPKTEQARVEAEPASKPADSKPMPPPSARPPFLPDLFTPAFGQDRRHFPRIRCFIAVELRCEGWETPVWGNLSNVSSGGCYIETVEPIRKNTNLEVGLWANNGKVWVKGIVINGVVTENNPTFGVRLQYTDMDPGGRETLRFFLKFVEDTLKNYEKQSGYLAQLKR